jgi:hypothetical protein
MGNTNAADEAALLPEPEDSHAPPPFYRTSDWWTFAVTSLLIFIGYLLTLSPDVTLDDSGELATASMWAAVPNPPGHPFWTVLTWLFTKLVPVSTVAYQVALASAVAAALACGLVALMVSRGSRMMIEGIASLKDIDRQRQDAVCAVAGFVGATLLGFTGVVWSQAVIVQTYALSLFFLVVTLAILLRWVYAPNQRRYIYWVACLFGICITSHQLLIVAAMGLEIAIIAGEPKLGRDLLGVNCLCWLAMLCLKLSRVISLFDSVTHMVFVIFNGVGVLSLLGLVALIFKTRGLFTEWKSVLIMVGLWFAGVSFYFYLPLASMTNPPMNWGYPRTVEGFWHVLSRGQYDKCNPADFIRDPGRMLDESFMYFSSAAEEFTPVCLLIAVVPFLFFLKMQKRERGWMIGMAGIFLCLSLLLTDLLNPTRERQTSSLVKVFFASSYVPIAIWIGCGFALAGAWLAAHYQRVQLGWVLALFTVTPLASVVSHWADSEQRGHLFGFWFGHDMFSPPFHIYPEMERNAVLFGGTDPGRFCPTYMIFCESFSPPRKRIDPQFDRRDVYVLTQNALADNTYLDYIRAQYNRSTQIDPPFFQNFLSGSLPGIFHGPTRMFAFLDDVFEGLGATVEKRRRTGTSWFTPDQITQPQSLAATLRKSDHQTPLSSFLYGKLSADTQHLVDTSTDDAALRRALSKDFTAILADGNIYDPKRFQDVKLPPLIENAAASPTLLPNNIIRLNRRMLEDAYPGQMTRSLGGLYPDTEIITPTPDDSADCFNDYLSDAQRRLTHDSQFPNEPRQIKPGEDLHMDRDRVEVSGQVAVMSINGLLTKVIFDKNPLHEFYLEESFPLDWMYSHLTPFGIIMKINRQPVPEITQEIVDKDHAFWDQFSVRTIGNWITYDTTVKQVCDWAQDVYLRHDFHSFTGDRKFVHDDDAQKAFSKLRSSIGSSIYQWRSREANSKNPIERARVTREAEFAFKQALAYCPYSPEAVFHFMDLLLSQNRVDEALLILRTCHKLDPYNSQISDWIDQLSRDKLSNPNDDPNALMELANRYLRASDLVKSEQVLQRLATVMPNNSEALYNLAVIQAHRGETSLAVASLQKCLTLNAAEIVKDPKVINLRQHLFQDQNFVEFRGTPEFKTAFATNR